ncbi:MAG: DUF4394 domain-containing protein [Ferruginibacter sp.]
MHKSSCHSYAYWLQRLQKTALDTPLVPNEETTASDAAGRLGYTNYNRNLTFYALTNDNRIDKYSTSIPKRQLNSAAITGLQPAENILAVDFRPVTGQLYGLGSSSRIYVINPTTGTARAIGAGPFTPALVGDIAGFDFNPTVDRIRIVTSSGQNLRANPETGTIAFVDGNINGQPGAIISGAAYTNSAAGATTTTLYDVDKESNNLYLQSPPNNGTLALVGSLGLDVEDGGFDIYGTSDAFGLFTINNRSNLVAIDLTTGQANIINDYPQTYRGIAIATAPVAYSVDGNNNLLIFNPQIYYDATNSNTIISKPLTGLAVGESVAGIDFRPLNGQLYALGSNSNIYTVNTASGALTLVSALSTALNGTNFGFDFNPLVDRIRIVSNTGQNLRYNPIDFSVTVDGSLNPGSLSISAAAYSNNFAGTTSTILYGIDSLSSQLVQVNPPNNGTIVPIGNLGVTVSGVNGFDIGGTSGIAYTIFRSANNRSRLYIVNLATGMASGRGIIGLTEMNGLAIGLGF